MEHDTDRERREAVAPRRRRHPLAAWLLLVALLAVLGYVFAPLPHEKTVQAQSPALAARTAEGATPEPAPPKEREPDAVPEKPILPELTGPPYIGPRAPEFTGSPAPSGLGLMDGTLFGHPVLGIHPELLRRVRQAELASDPGVEMIVAYRAGSRAHSTGRAVDINYYANPYMMHERGEELLDVELGAVYHRIARLMLDRDSVIPEEITKGSPDPERTLRLYRSLREESRAMIAYFRLMQDRNALTRFLSSRTTPSGDAQQSAETIQRQMMRDYVTLSGRAGPRITGLEYPAPQPLPGDPPFAGEATYRAPELGFMNLREELVQALTDAGVRWGGTDMGTASGDLMHFYIPQSELE